MILMTAKGETVNVEWIARAELDRNLYIGARDITPAEAVNLFCDPSRTKTMTVYKDDQNMDDESTVATWIGFTRFVSVRVNDIEGTINIGLGLEEITG